MSNKLWNLHEGDCIPFMLQDESEGGMAAKSIDLAVFSPPFSGSIQLYIARM